MMVQSILILPIHLTSINPNTSTPLIPYLAKKTQQNTDQTIENVVEREKSYLHTATKKERKKNPYLHDLFSEWTNTQELIRTGHVIPRCLHSKSCRVLKRNKNVLSARKDNTWRNLIMSPPKKVIPKPKKVVVKKDSAFDTVAKYLACYEGTECNLQVAELYPPILFKDSNFLLDLLFLQSDNFVNRKSWMVKMECRHGIGLCLECEQQKRTGKTIFHRHHDQHLCSECVKSGHYLIADSDVI